MKVSIWQQFSSNHSNSFTVVGKFESEEVAKKAADEFQVIIKSVADYRDKYWIEHGVFYIENASETEKAFGKKYDVDWTKHLDWMSNDNKVARFDNYVIVDDGGASTWKGALYVDQIMKSLGAEIYVQEEMGSDGISIAVCCEAISIDKAKELQGVVEAYLTGENHDPPWREISKQIFHNDDYTIYDATYTGQVSRSQKQLNFSNFTFAAIGDGLPILVAYLKQEGCINIEYTIEQRPYNEIYDENNNS